MWFLFGLSFDFGIQPLVTFYSASTSKCRGKQWERRMSKNSLFISIHVSKWFVLSYPFPESPFIKKQCRSLSLLVLYLWQCDCSLGFRLNSYGKLKVKCLETYWRKRTLLRCCLWLTNCSLQEKFSRMLMENSSHVNSLFCSWIVFLWIIQIRGESCFQHRENSLACKEI